MSLANLLIPKGPAKTFEEHLAKTQVSDAVLTALETMPDPAPVIMLNLVRFRPHRDPTLYMRYGAVAGRGETHEVKHDEGRFVRHGLERLQHGATDLRLGEVLLKRLCGAFGDQEIGEVHVLYPS